MNLSPLVLVVEDEAQILEILEGYLKQELYRVERARDGEEALSLFRSVRPDLILLDLGLPRLGGLEVLRAVRGTSSVPVICVTARAEEVDHLLGLELGADDYVTKPFRPRELMARVRAVLRRSQSPGGPRTVEPPIRLGALEIDSYSVEVKVSGQRLEFTPTEFRLLYTLARAPGRAYSRLELIEAAMPDSSALERVVDAHLMSVRRKLEAVGVSGLLHTVRGVGYRLEVQQSPLEAAARAR